MTNAWPWREKSKATVFPACNSWLNFCVRGQFEIKTLIVWCINTTYFIWIKKKITLEPATILKQVTCQRITSKKYSNSMGRHPVLTAVNWSQYWCAICVQYQFSCAPKLTRKCEIEHWLPCGADGRTGGRAGGWCTVKWLPNFLGWVDLLSYGAPLTRALRAWSSAIIEFHNLRIIFLLPKYIYHPTSRVSLCLFLYWGRIFLYTDQCFGQHYLDLYGF